MSLSASVVDESSKLERNSGVLGVGATMSERLWNLDWDRERPWNTDEVTSERGSFLQDALPFMRAHYPAIFPDAEHRWFLEPMTEAKLRYMSEADVVVIRSEGRTVGLFVGHPTDWSTYYVRTLAVLPSHRRRGILKLVNDGLIRVLPRYGVVRLEADSSPANRAMMTMFTENGWLITATSNHDRWGSMLRYTRYLDEEAERVFRKQFVYAPKFGRGEQ